MLSVNKTKIIHAEVNSLPRLNYSLPSDTVYSFCWASVWVDEAHETRTAKALWLAVAAIMELSLLKVVMTATPLLEQPDVR
jgi:hypothetical protein